VRLWSLTDYKNICIGYKFFARLGWGDTGELDGKNEMSSVEMADVDHEAIGTRGAMHGEQSFQ